MKKILLIGLITLFVSVCLNAQTTELAYSLGKSSSSLKITSIDTDASNNIFVCGNYQGTNINFNPLGDDSLKTSSNQNGFIAKYNTAGILQRLITFGSTNIDKANKVYIDANNNVYLLAHIIGSTTFTGTSGFGENGGAGAIVVVKYNSSLDHQTSKLIRTQAGAQGDDATDIKVDALGNIYVTGRVFNTNLDFNWAGIMAPASSESISPNTAGSTDAFVAKINSSFVTQWARAIGGASGDGGSAIELDNAGNIYLTGFFRGQNVNVSLLSGETNTISESGGSAAGDVFVAKYNSTMNYQWAFNIGASGYDEGNALLVNKTTGDVYVAGMVNKQGINVKFDPASTTSGLYTPFAAADIFLASYTSAGAYRWHRGIGGLGTEAATAMTFDASSNIVMTGYFQGKVGFAPNDTITAIGNKDVFVTVVSPLGVTNTSFNVGGTGNEQSNGIAYSSNGKVHIVGDFDATGDYDPTALTKTLTLQGTLDGFITRYLLCSKPVITAITPNTNACVGATNKQFSVTATGATSYQWRKNGVLIGTASASNTYTIATVALTDDAIYSVDAINACGTTLSTEFTLTVNSKPSITTEPASKATCEEVSVSFVSAATGMPAPTFSWTKNGSVVSSTTNTLIISSPQATDAGTYKVKATNNCGSVESAGAVLTVNTNAGITTHPSSKAVCLQTTTTLSVLASGSTLTYQWKKGATTLSNNTTYSGVSTNVLTISNITAAELASYTVVVSGACGSPITSNAAVLSKSTSPAITISTQPTDKAVLVGATITLSVTASNGSGVLTYQWKKGSANLVNSERISGATSPTLTITGALVADSDDYSCVISSTCANDVTSNLVEVVVTTVTGISEAQAQGFKLSPNPSTERFVLSNDHTPFHVEQLELVSPQGTSVMKRTISASGQLNESVNVQSLAPAVYILLIKGEGQQTFMKVIVE